MSNDGVLIGVLHPRRLLWVLSRILRTRASAWSSTKSQDIICYNVSPRSLMLTSWRRCQFLQVLTFGAVCKKNVQKDQKKEIRKKTEFCSKTRAPAAQTLLLSARVKYTVVNISLNGWPPPTIFSKTFCWRRSAMAGGWFTPKKFVCFFSLKFFLHIFSFNIFSSRKKLAV